MQMTGITSGVVQGTETEFEMFAKRCIEAFMGECELNFQKEDLFDKEVETSDIASSIADCNYKLSQLSNDTNGISYLRASLYEKIKDHSIWLKEAEDANERVYEMIKKAEAYIAPSEGHKAFKQFMLDQLYISTQDDTIEYHKKALEEAKQDLSSINKTYMELKAKEIENCLENLRNSIKTLKQLRAERRKKNEWLKAVYKSLK